MAWRDEVADMIVRERDRTIFSAPNNETEWASWFRGEIPKQVNRDTALQQLIDRVKELEKALSLEYIRTEQQPPFNTYSYTKKVKHDKKVQPRRRK